MTQQLIAVDANALASLQDELTEIKRLLLASKINPPAKWITVAEYAQKVGKSEATVRRWIRDGQLERKQKLVKNPDA
ncbi:DNA-binding protein [Phaeobacter sp. LSS9]|uniref:DNA-binding protein n=1 Tax=unclassified Phaeobacter TaxID=2621772 RepID=UPI000E556E40|nr:DNA-binding protein [Phaeobacter sp. LSS9]AXT33775.1 DNA-binding protein [Phaeobacter sp. LSS9]